MPIFTQCSAQLCKKKKKFILYLSGDLQAGGCYSLTLRHSPRHMMSGAAQANHGYKLWQSKGLWNEVRTDIMHWQEHWLGCLFLFINVDLTKETYSYSVNTGFRYFFYPDSYSHTVVCKGLFFNNLSKQHSQSSKQWLRKYLHPY